jgi:hypothetical protein
MNKSGDSTVNKWDLCAEFVHLAQAQHDALERDDIEEFERLMGLREDKMRLLESLASERAFVELTPVAEKPSGAVLHWPIEATAEFKERSGRSLAAKIVEALRQDEENRRLLVDKMASVRIQLQQLREGRAAVGHYGKLAPGHGASFLDCQG